MSKGSEFLPEVLDLIEKRLGEIDENIQAVRQDINSMNEYYWDNYTEMDQYGYEDYDNQQALKMQVNASMTEKTSRKIFTSESVISQESVAHCHSFTTGEPRSAACFMTTTKARRPTKRRAGAWTERFYPNGSTKSVAAR